jgi:hypothetical protein
VDEVTITIPRIYFERLSTWASVGRTIDEAVRLLDQAEVVDDDPHLYCIRELLALKQALDACNAAAKHKLHLMQAEGKQD